MEFNESEINNAKLIYLRYLAIKHYFHGNFNYFLYNGIMNKKSAIGFEKKTNELRACVSLYKKYKNLDVIEKVLVLMIKDNSQYWIGESSAIKRRDDGFIGFRKFIESSEYIFKQETKKIFSDKEYSYEKYFESTKKHKHSLVFSMYEEGLIREEVLIILNLMFDNFLDKIYSEQNDFIFEIPYMKIKKYEKMLVYWKIFSILDFKKLVNNK